MSVTERLKRIPKSSLPVLMIVLVGVALISFLAGLVPMWIKAHGEQKAVESLERDAVLMKLENNLASATIDARGGRYELARRQASLFFTALRFQIDQGRESAISQNNLQHASTLLKDRDELITLLARGDAAAADRVANLYVACRQITALGERISGQQAAEDGDPLGGSP